MSLQCTFICVKLGINQLNTASLRPFEDIARKVIASKDGG